MNKIDHNQLPELLLHIDKIARKAGEEILEIYETDFSIANKEDNSPLTTADTAAHKIICQGLLDLTPDIPILSEESSHINFSERQKWKQYWLVDPLDGTREFIKKNGEFKAFGTGKKKTVLPFWLFILVSIIISYYLAHVLIFIGQSNYN